MDEKLMVIPAPLPTEVPPPPDLSMLPLPILHSGTVETLIGQNEDLMARLKVNIRRNSVLEQQIMQHERLNTELSHINGSLTAQMQVLQEKDRIWREKASRQEMSQNQIQEQTKLLGARIIGLEEKNRALHAAARFERRVQRWVRPMVDRLKQALTEERRARISRDAQLGDVKARLTEAVTYAREVENRLVKDQTKLVENYENRQKALQTELDKVRHEAKIHRDKSTRMDEIVSMRAELENKVIAFERKCQELEKFTHVLEEKTKTAAMENSGRDRQLINALADLESTRADASRMKEQVDSLQGVWAESQQRLEAAKLQNENLNRLNQELARRLKEQRAQTPKDAGSGDAPLDFN